MNEWKTFYGRVLRMHFCVSSIVLTYRIVLYRTYLLMWYGANDSMVWCSGSVLLILIVMFAHIFNPLRICVRLTESQTTGSKQANFYLKKKKMTNNNNSNHKWNQNFNAGKCTGYFLWLWIFVLYFRLCNALQINALHWISTFYIDFDTFV